MLPTDLAHRGWSHQEDYGLDAVAKHNAAVSKKFPLYHRGERSLEDDYTSAHDRDSIDYDNPPTPRSDHTSDGVRTRSGRSTKRQTESPHGSIISQTSKSPSIRPKRTRKRGLDKSKTPKLTAPLSVLTKSMSLPIRDIESWVNRSAEERRKEAAKRNGYITRPMNSFMLYRSAYAERTKQWCLQNNHQVVSSVSGESWPMEPQEVRNQFDLWAKIERANHQAAHPEYKFSPSKTPNKRRKGNITDDEEDDSDLDGDPDGEYRGGRIPRQRKPDRKETTQAPGGQVFTSHPYYGHHGVGYDQTQYQAISPGRVVSSTLMYEPHGLPYGAQPNPQFASNPYQHIQYPYTQEMHEMRAVTPNSLSGVQSLGGYGLPSAQVPLDDTFYDSRTVAPMQSFLQYGQALYPQYAIPYRSTGHQNVYASGSSSARQHEHQQYLLQASGPCTAIDPNLGVVAEATSVRNSRDDHLEQAHFDDGAAEMAGAQHFAGLREYYELSTSPSDVNATLAPTWVPDDMK